MRVGQNVEAAVASSRRLDDARAIIRVRDVRHHGRRFATIRGDRRHSLAQPLLGQIDGDHLRALLGEPRGRCPADPGCYPGDHGNLVCKPV